MSISKKLSTIAQSTRAKRQYLFRHYNEKRKMKDPRRVKILNTFELSADQQKSIDNLYIENYGKKIPYDWHKYYSAYTGNFDVNYFPELLYIPEFEAFENLWPEYCKVFSDKNVLPAFAKQAGIKTPSIVASCTKGMYRDSNYQQIDLSQLKEILHNKGKIFIKPTVGTSSGQGCFIANFENGFDTITGQAIEEIIIKCESDFVIQDVLICHKSISDIYSYSVNTFRVITYRWNNSIEYMPVLMRIGQGKNYLDNAHAGGMFIAVNDDGSLHDKAFTEFHDIYTSHPDSGVVFDNYKIHGVKSVIDAAMRMHVILPQVGVVNWDFTIDENGDPVLIEANVSGGSIWLSEIAHGIGAFKERTPEVLQWLKLMNKLSVSERYKHAFGKLD